MDRQRIYETVRAHLAAQGRRAVMIKEDGKPVCAYRTPDGLKCAIGCLIPDELYNTDMESRGAVSVLKLFPKVAQHLGVVDHDDESFLLSLQCSHDYSFKGGVDNLVAEIDEVAARNGLVLVR